MLLSWGGLDSCAEERNSATLAHFLDVAPQRGFTESAQIRCLRSGGPEAANRLLSLDVRSAGPCRTDTPIVNRGRNLHIDEVKH